MLYCYLSLSFIDQVAPKITQPQPAVEISVHFLNTDLVKKEPRIKWKAAEEYVKYVAKYQRNHNRFFYFITAVPFINSLKNHGKGMCFSSRQIHYLHHLLTLLYQVMQPFHSICCFLFLTCTWATNTHTQSPGAWQDIVPLLRPPHSGNLSSPFVPPYEPTATHTHRKSEYNTKWLRISYVLWHWMFTQLKYMRTVQEGRVRKRRGVFYDPSPNEKTLAGLSVSAWHRLLYTPLQSAGSRGGGGGGGARGRVQAEEIYRNSNITFKPVHYIHMNCANSLSIWGCNHEPN